MRTEQFLEGYESCTNRLVEILRLKIPIDEKMEKIKHLAEFVYYEHDGQIRWVDDLKKDEENKDEDGYL